MSVSICNRGSEWKKWDLHVHTPKSYEYSYHGPDVFEKIVERMLSSDCSCFAITDYNTLEGYKYIKEHYDLKEKVVFPAVEFRMKNLLVDRSAHSPTPINFHIIFTNEEEKYATIESFLTSLQFYDFNNNILNFVKNDIVNLGKQKNPQLTDDEELYKIGLANIRVDFDKVLEALDQKGLRNHALILMPFDEYGGIGALNSTTEGLLKSNFIKKSHIVGSGCLTERDYFLGKKKDKYTDDEFKLWIGVPKPCIKGSDSHHPDTVGIFPKDSNDKEKCCWIKADSNFEGLRQIVLEPELRVRIQEDNPRDFETYPLIEKCVLTLPSKTMILEEASNQKINFCLSGKYEINFSNNLSCFIGGRGSGKSAIIHILYNAWIKQEVGKLEDINSPLASLDFDSDPLTKVRGFTAVSIPEYSEFYLQNEIERFAKSIDEMSNLIRFRLTKLSLLDKQKKSLEFLKKKWEESGFNLETLISAYDIISNKNNQIKGLEENIGILKKQTQVIKSNEYKEFQKIIAEISEKISSFKQYSEEHRSILERIDILSKISIKANWDATKGKDILDELNNALTIIRKKLTEKYELMKKDHEGKDYLKALQKVKDGLTKYLESKGLPAENIEELTDANQQIKELEFQVATLREEKEPYDQIYNEKQVYIEEYKQKYLAYYKRYDDVRALLESELKNLKFDEKIIFSLLTNYEELRKNVAQFVKGNSSAKITFQTDEIQKVLFEDQNNIRNYVDNKQKIREHIAAFDKAATHKKTIQEFVANESNLEKLHLRIIKEYFDINNIQVQTKLGVKLLQNTSFGERCGIVIAIILVVGTNPIIIDQPEDHLDGKFISNILVPLIREKKKYRQIFLVTRDANIVIGGDAELINILDNVNQKTTIIPSSIENIEFRDKYVWVLDGGRVAFQKRDEKYNFQG